MESRGWSHIKDDFKSFPNCSYFLKNDQVFAEIRASKGHAILFAKVYKVKSVQGKPIVDMVLDRTSGS